MAHEGVKTGQARSLRRRMTTAERRLWSRLRAGRLDGLKWARQEPIGRYVVDFYCSGARVVVELEGDAHGYTRTDDGTRQAWLEEQGLMVLRFSNDSVFERLGGVLGVILEACSAAIPGTR